MLQKVENILKAQLYKRQELDFHIWVFSSVDNCNFNYNSKYLFLYVRDTLPEIKPVFVINDKKSGSSCQNNMVRDFLLTVFAVKE